MGIFSRPSADTNSNTSTGTTGASAGFSGWDPPDLSSASLADYLGSGGTR